VYPSWISPDGCRLYAMCTAGADAGFAHGGTLAPCVAERMHP